MKSLSELWLKVCIGKEKGYFRKIDKSAEATHVWKVKSVIDHKLTLLKQTKKKTGKNILIAKNKDLIINFEIPWAD